MADDSAAQKDGKGNVIVSVRVRPDVGAKDSKQETDWEVSNKKSLISYKGRDGGEHYYGMSHCMVHEVATRANW
jgi:centromeric protein E